MKTFRLLMAWMVVTVPAVAWSEAPRVRLDVPQTAAARDVTTRDFAFVYPQERLIEVRLPISLLLERGAARDISQLVHRIETATPTAQAVDYFPKTTLATSVVGTERVERQRVRDASASAEIAGGYPGLVSGQGRAEVTQHWKEELAHEQLPPLELLAASGTVGRGRGVYFKLHPSARTTLEGAHDYVMVLRVPSGWRGGLLYVTSEAIGPERMPLTGGETSRVVGRGRFVVALYQQGDHEARAVAQRCALAESALRKVAATHRAALRRSTFPTPLHRWGVTRDNALPADWQDQVIWRGVADAELLMRLPEDVRLAVETLLHAREELQALHHAPALAAIRG
jgi:hypothetical protein